MQKALEWFPTDTRFAYDLARQSWWRPGIHLVAKSYLGDQTWNLYLRYNNDMYSVVYDVLDAAFDDIDPLPIHFDGTFRYSQEV